MYHHGKYIKIKFNVSSYMRISSCPTMRIVFANNIFVRKFSLISTNYVFQGIKIFMMESRDVMVELQYALKFCCIKIVDCSEFLKDMLNREFRNGDSNLYLSSTIM